MNSVAGKPVYDCEACEKGRICLKDGKKQTVRRQGFSDIEIDRGSYELLYTEWNRVAEKSGFPELDILREFGVCPIPIITAESSYLLELYGLLDGVGTVNLFELLEYPSIYIDAVKIIRHEIDKAVLRYKDK